MFAAGLGLGLMFYGISEPITHFSAPPHGEAAPQTAAATEVALRYTYFHWGFNGWALYAVMGLALAGDGQHAPGERDRHVLRAHAGELDADAQVLAPGEDVGGEDPGVGDAPLPALV